MEHPGFFERAAPMPLHVLADKLGARIASGADGAALIHDVRPLSEAGRGDLAFLDNRKYLAQLEATHASAAPAPVVLPTAREGSVVVFEGTRGHWFDGVDPGTTPQDRPESGVLRFHNPHHYSNYFLDAGNARLAAPYHHGSWNVRFQPGQLVLFPSWLQHEVMPFYGDDERITVAFNCWFGMKNEA